MFERNWDIVIEKLEKDLPKELVEIVLEYYYVFEHPHPENIYLVEDSLIKQIITYSFYRFVFNNLIYSKYEKLYLSIWLKEDDINYHLILDLPLDQYIKEYRGKNPQLQEKLIYHNFL